MNLTCERERGLKVISKNQDEHSQRCDLGMRNIRYRQNRSRSPIIHSNKNLELDKQNRDMNPTCRRDSGLKVISKNQDEHSQQSNHGIRDIRYRQSRSRSPIIHSNKNLELDKHNRNMNPMCGRDRGLKIILKNQDQHSQQSDHGRMDIRHRQSRSRSPIHSNHKDPENMERTAVTDCNVNVDNRNVNILYRRGMNSLHCESSMRESRDVESKIPPRGNVDNRIDNEHDEECSIAVVVSNQRPPESVDTFESQSRDGPYHQLSKSEGDWRRYNRGHVRDRQFRGESVFNRLGIGKSRGGQQLRYFRGGQKFRVVREFRGRREFRGGGGQDVRGSVFNRLGRQNAQCGWRGSHDYNGVTSHRNRGNRQTWNYSHQSCDRKNYHNGCKGEERGIFHQHEIHHHVEVFNRDLIETRVNITTTNGNRKVENHQIFPKLVNLSDEMKERNKMTDISASICPQNESTEKQNDCDKSKQLDGSSSKASMEWGGNSTGKRRRTGKSRSDLDCVNQRLQKQNMSGSTWNRWNKCHEEAADERMRRQRVGEPHRRY